MAGFKNTLITFIFIGIFIALFIGLIAILFKILILGVVIGAILSVFYWIKGKLFPGSVAEDNFKKFTNSVFIYTSARSKTGRANQHHTNTNTYTNFERSDSTGRIIDVEPEDR